MNTKIILTVLGMAALVATPAFAAKKVHRAPASEASASDAAMMRPVVSDDRVIGTDPDPSIRSELARDASTYSSTN
ncbi:MAG TPA: hypothetical protein VH249_23500 [Xanthobacteraceae bacterium]|jgi:hypothetical protein|nr:hypothetical protein [Xanthobacteraceae bacterium]